MHSNLALVFTMHKVGSSTVMQALRENGRVPERGSIDNIDVISPVSKYEAVITPVRDPIARNISYCFEIYGKDILKKKLTNDAIFEVFFKSGIHESTKYWFERVFEPLFDIDVYQYGFIKKNGWKILNHRYLLIQTEQMTEMLPDALWSLFGEQQPGSWGHRAKTEDTRSYGKIYAEFVNWVKFEDGYLDAMYESKYVKHFYSDEQIESMRSRWSKK